MYACLQLRTQALFRGSSDPALRRILAHSTKQGMLCSSSIVNWQDIRSQTMSSPGTAALSWDVSSPGCVTLASLLVWLLRLVTLPPKSLS